MPTIVIADDDEALRLTIGETLKRAGHEVITCADGKEVSAVLERITPALLITDLFMPETEGLATIISARRSLPDLKIIAISAGTRLTDRDFLPVAQRLGAQRTLHKPFSAETLLRTVQEVLGNQRE